MTISHTDEYLDLVDENDHVIGTKARSEIYADNLRNFRVVNLFIVNSEGKLWIPRRTAHKKNFPLHLDMSMGGHVDSGETYEVAVVREAKEELNIDLDISRLRLLGYLRPHIDGELRSFMKVYELNMDEVPQYNPEDFVESFWIDPAELMQRIAGGELAKPDLSVLVRKFYIDQA